MDRRRASHAHPVTARRGGRGGGIDPRILVVVAAAALVLLGGVLFLGRPGGPTNSAGATLTAGGSVPSSRPAPSPVASAVTPGPPTATASGSPGSPSPAPTPVIGPVAVVPVVQYRSGMTSITTTDVKAKLAAKPSTPTIELVEDQADAILTALGTSRAAAGARLVTARDAATLMADLAAHHDRIAFMRADQVGPGIRAIGWRGVELFGVHRLEDVAKWTLRAQLPTTLPGVVPYDPKTTWTMWAGGDIGLDRSVAKVVTLDGMGVDYPYDGGTARIARLVCCSPFGWKVPVIVSTGHKGAMRDLISSADIAVANMEEAAPDHFTFHPHGTVFTGNPALLAGVARAGIDVVSTASNHVGDAGKAGILQTLASLKRYGIQSFGAGKNLAEARKPAMLTIAGVKVAILAFDGITAKLNGATATTVGDSPLNAASVKAGVTAARKAGAAVVIVWPHWGVEYTFGPNTTQTQLAHVAIDAGADMVIGNHPHWVQSVEVYKGKPIWYALGNFTFDQSWSEPTLEGVSLELTFRGGSLVQARMLPHILVKAVQPNLLDPAGDGRRVLDPVFKASGKRLPW